MEDQESKKCLSCSINLNEQLIPAIWAWLHYKGGDLLFLELGFKFIKFCSYFSLFNLGLCSNLITGVPYLFWVAIDVIYKSLIGSQFF